MLEVKLMRDEGIAVIIPSGALETMDFKRLAMLVDPYIAKHGKLNGLLIYADSFPGWDDFNALLSHIKFINHHHKKIKRIAAIANGKLKSKLPALINQLVSAEVRYFDYHDRNNAINWLQQAA